MCTIHNVPVWLQSCKLGNHILVQHLEIHMWKKLHVRARVCVLVLLITEVYKKEKMNMNGSTWPGQLQEKLNKCAVQSQTVLYILGT